MLKIVHGITGSVASKLSDKLYQSLSEDCEVLTVATENARNFTNIECKTDDDEWNVWYFDQRVLHIDVRQQASALLIAPLSANTLAKIANGICDNMLTSVVRAWDMNRPLILAPAMNTHMWNHPLTDLHIKTISKLYDNVYFVDPVEKKLVCGDTGIGAMAPIDEIKRILDDSLMWEYPIEDCRGVPVNNHPGAFGYKRKYDTHTGVDLYCEDRASVFAVESGTVVSIENFTGPSDNTPWWNDTQCIMIEGASGVVNYGEIKVERQLAVGDQVRRNCCIGTVKQVLKEGKERPDIPGHSKSMLHVELYEHGTKQTSPAWELGVEKPPFGLKDPTPFLLNTNQGFKETLQWETSSDN